MQCWAMDDIVQSLQRAYQALIASGLSIMEAKEAQAADPQGRFVRNDAAFELFHNNLQLFHAACDRAQEILESVRLRIGSECIVDEATGSISAKLAKIAEEGTKKQGVAPLSAIRLEQLSRAVRGLVLDLQQGAASTTQSGPSQSGLNVNGPVEGRQS